MDYDSDNYKTTSNKREQFWRRDAQGNWKIVRGNLPLKVSRQASSHSVCLQSAGARLLATCSTAA